VRDKVHVFLFLSFRGVDLQLCVDLHNLFVCNDLGFAKYHAAT